MAKQSIVATTQDTLIGAAKTTADGIKTLTDDVSQAAVGSALGAVSSVVKGTGRLVRRGVVKLEKVNAKRRAQKTRAKKKATTARKARRAVKKSAKKVAKRAVKKSAKTVKRAKTATPKAARKVRATAKRKQAKKRK